MAEFLHNYQHVFVFLILVGVLYLVWKESKFELGVSDAATPKPTSGMLGKMYGSF